MLPLRDDVPSRRLPVVNYAMIGLCTVVFFMQLAEGKSGSSLVERFGMIPYRVLNPDKPVMIPTRDTTAPQPGGETTQRPAAESPINPWLTLVTCVFLHGGWMHFLGNMWFLYIFGDNVEDCFGHVGYFLFYIAAGVAASATHLLTNTGSPIPTIGASGAIAGVMGAYFLLYPHAKVVAVVPLFVMFTTIVLPAPVFLGFWFVLQLFQGVAGLGNVQSTGVAWWAHIGGFVAGLAAAGILGKSGVLNPTVEDRRPTPSRTGGPTTSQPHSPGRGQKPASRDPFGNDPFFK